MKTRAAFLLPWILAVSSSLSSAQEPPSAYAQWETDNGITGAGADADSDGDGIRNGIEFVIGGDPSGPNSDSNSLLPTVTVDATNLYFVYRRTENSKGYNPFLEYSSSLGGWIIADTGADGVVTVEDQDFFGSGIDRVTVQIPRELASGSKLFARLAVEIPP